MLANAETVGKERPALLGIPIAIEELAKTAVLAKTWEPRIYATVLLDSKDLLATYPSYNSAGRTPAKMEELVSIPAITIIACAGMGLKARIARMMSMIATPILVTMGASALMEPIGSCANVRLVSLALIVKLISMSVRPILVEMVERVWMELGSLIVFVQMEGVESNVKVFILTLSIGYLIKSLF